MFHSLQLLEGNQTWTQAIVVQRTEGVDLRAKQTVSVHRKVC